MESRVSSASAVRAHIDLAEASVTRYGWKALAGSVTPDNRLSISHWEDALAQPLVPSTAFADAWIQVDRTENPRFFVSLLDATRARLLERARKSPREFFAPLALRAGLNVLDVGCGTGTFFVSWLRLFLRGKPSAWISVETMIAEARQRSAGNVDNLSFRVGSVLELPFPAASFDRVLATQLLLHVPDPRKALVEMKRVLAPSGVISHYRDRLGNAGRAIVGQRTRAPIQRPRLQGAAKWAHHTRASGPPSRAWIQSHCHPARS